MRQRPPLSNKNGESMRSGGGGRGPAQEVYFVHEHRAGELCESDFTHLTDLEITIAGQPLAHMLYHFVLTYSNWETGTSCYTESFASLSEGLQNALWELAACPCSTALIE